MGSHILPIGWNNWGNPANEKTVLYAEYQSTGEGANPTKRATWSRQLSKKNYVIIHWKRFLVQKNKLQTGGTEVSDDFEVVNVECLIE
jgi:hypothetical protein